MDYFSNFPIMYYTLNQNNSVEVIRDITKRVGLSKELRESVLMYDPYVIMDGETPDMISTKVYGVPDYAWVITTCNDMVGVDEWPFSQEDLWTIISKKYADPLAIHHYENSNGRWVPVGTSLAIPMTNFDYESKVNDAKRSIRLLKAQALSPFVDQFKEELTK